MIGWKIANYCGFGLPSPDLEVESGPYRETTSKLLSHVQIEVPW